MILYVLVAATIFIPVVFFTVKNDMKTLTYDQSTDLKNDNSFLLNYRTPEITLNNINVNVEGAKALRIPARDYKDPSNDFIALFGATASVPGNGSIPVEITYVTNFKPEHGVYRIKFNAKCTYPDGVERESVMEAKIVYD